MHCVFLINNRFTYLFGWIQTCQTGGQMYNDYSYTHKVSECSLRWQCCLHSFFELSVLDSFIFESIFVTEKERLLHFSHFDFYFISVGAHFLLICQLALAKLLLEEACLLDSNWKLEMGSFTKDDDDDNVVVCSFSRRKDLLQNGWSVKREIGKSEMFFN